MAIIHYALIFGTKRQGDRYCPRHGVYPEYFGFCPKCQNH